MVAFVSGDGVGLGNSSFNILGTQGEVGSSNVGRIGDQVFVNVATGNLVVQRQDDFLSILGQDISVVRTYNSLGLVDGDNNDGWRLGLVKGVRKLTGTLNSAGSTMMPPTTVSLPLKILMFVLVDGWSLLLKALVGSFR
jgi:hypothetical protein